MLVSAFNARVSEILQDTNATTWTIMQLIEWLNDAARTLVLVRPDASNVIASILLAAGTRQALTGAADMRLISVDRNMGAGGTTAGRAHKLDEKKSKETLTPHWQTATA